MSCEVSGKITDASQNSIIYASLVLLKDSKVAYSGISSTTGAFKITGIAPDIYQLKVEYIAHETYLSAPFEVSANFSKILPDIILKKSVTALSEVNIVHKKAMIEVKADKLIFNVSSSPSASGTNGLDLLKKAPGVTLDLDNNISILGKSDVQVYLNGVPSRLSGADLTTFLQSLTSDVIDSIEIITNPSSKYDAEGTGGIINIRMKKNMSTGFNGSATSSFTQGEAYKSSNNISLNYGAEKIKTNFDITQSNDNELEFFKDEKQQENSLLKLRSKEDKIRKGYNIGLGLEANLTESQTISLSARGIFNDNENRLNSTTAIYQANPLLFEQTLYSQSTLDGASNNYNFNVNHFWHTTKTATISTNVSLGSYDKKTSTQQPNTYIDGNGNANPQNNAFDTATNISLWSGKIDFDKEWEKITFATGLKYAQIITKNGFTFYTIPNAIPLLDPTKSNDFNYTESVAAMYANLKWQFSKSISANAGIRVENTASRGQLISDIQLDNKDVQRNYTDYFPNLGLSWDNQKNHSASISVGRRITRPNYQDLNPFESPTSQLVVWKGNPFLKPNYIMNYQASYAYKSKLIFTGSYSETRDFFARIIEITGENKTQIIPRNLPKATNLGISASYPLTVNKYWEVALFGNASRKNYKGNAENTAINVATTYWNYRLQNNLNLPKGFLVDVTFEQQSRWVWRGSVYIKGTEGLSFGIRKDFLDKKLQIRITGSDILRSESDYPYYSNYGGIALNGVYSEDARRYGLGATYKFGNQKAKNKRKTNTALEDELNRIGN